MSESSPCKPTRSMPDVQTDWNMPAHVRKHPISP